jgi:hypothetical protein
MSHKIKKFRQEHGKVKEVANAIYKSIKDGYLTLEELKIVVNLVEKQLLKEIK